MKIQPTSRSKKRHYGKNGSIVYLHTGIWHNKETGEIHISGPKEERFHSTVSNNPESKRYHPNLGKKEKGVRKRGQRRKRGQSELRY